MGTFGCSAVVNHYDNGNFLQCFSDGKAKIIIIIIFVYYCCSQTLQPNQQLSRRTALIQFDTDVFRISHITVTGTQRVSRVGNVRPRNDWPKWRHCFLHCSTVSTVAAVRPALWWVRRYTLYVLLCVYIADQRRPRVMLHDKWLLPRPVQWFIFKNTVDGES